MNRKEGEKDSERTSADQTRSLRICNHINQLRLWSEFTRVLQQCRDIFRRGLPRAHESRAAADEVIELPSFLAQALIYDWRELGEDGVRIDTMKDRYAFNLPQAFGKSLGIRIGLTGIIEPDVVFEHPQPLSRYEAHFGTKLARLFTTISKVL